MATVARFQGGLMDGQEQLLDERMPVQSYIVVDTLPAEPLSMDPQRTAELGRQTYKRAGTGYRGDTRIITYRLEG